MYQVLCLSMLLTISLASAGLVAPGQLVYSHEGPSLAYGHAGHAIAVKHAVATSYANSNLVSLHPALVQAHVAAPVLHQAAYAAPVLQAAPSLVVSHHGLYGH